MQPNRPTTSTAAMPTSPVSDNEGATAFPVHQVASISAAPATVPTQGAMPQLPEIDDAAVRAALTSEFPMDVDDAAVSNPTLVADIALPEHLDDLTAELWREPWNAEMRFRLETLGLTISDPNFSFNLGDSRLDNIIGSVVVSNPTTQLAKAANNQTNEGKRKKYLVLHIIDTLVNKGNVSLAKATENALDFFQGTFDFYRDTYYLFSNALRTQQNKLTRNNPAAITAEQEVMAFEVAANFIYNNYPLPIDFIFSPAEIKTLIDRINLNSKTSLNDLQLLLFAQHNLFVTKERITALFMRNNMQKIANTWGYYPEANQPRTIDSATRPIPEGVITDSLGPFAGSS